jgi:tetratricopeptide (TPR) repeat protein
MFAPICALAGNGGGPSAMPEEAVHNQEGMAHFHHGYYKLIPRGRRSEAGRQMDLAEEAFLDALEINPGYVEARRNLARLYYLRGKFEEAAGEYGVVIELAPGDLDSYVQLALSQTGAGNFDGAIRTLETAREQTRDERILRQLDDYIEKIHQGE